MDDITYSKISKKAVKCWRIGSAIFTVFITAVIFVVYHLWFKQLILFLIPVCLGVLKIFILPSIEYRQWKYRIVFDRVETIHGIFFTERCVTPINRIQHLKITQGLIQKKLDISDINIYTAAGVHKIEAIPYDDAKLIIDRLNSTIIAEEENKNE